MKSFLISDRARTAVLVILGTIAYSIILGWAVDVVTANLAVEYFTIHHPRVVASESPWVMALIWGVIATWWAGLIGGVVLAGVNLRLKKPLSSDRILIMVGRSTLVLWLTMMSVVVIVYFLAELVPLHQRRATFESDRWLMAVAVGHLLEYILAGIAVLIVSWRMVWVSRHTNPTPFEVPSH